MRLQLVVYIHTKKLELGFIIVRRDLLEKQYVEKSHELNYMSVTLHIKEFCFIFCDMGRIYVI
jgi:hypothetical protein